MKDQPLAPNLWVGGLPTHDAVAAGVPEHFNRMLRTHGTNWSAFDKAADLLVMFLRRGLNADYLAAPHGVGFIGSAGHYLSVTTMYITRVTLSSYFVTSIYASMNACATCGTMAFP